MSPAASEAQAPERAGLVVVGAGIAGLSAARAAIDAGLEVVVVAGEQPAASAVAAGMIAPVGELSWGEEHLHRAAVAASSRWADFAEALERETGVPIPYRRRGAIHVALDRDEAAQLRRRASLIAEHGLEATELTRSAAREAEPGLAPSVSAALELPGEAEVDPAPVLEALGAIASSRATVVAATARRIEVEGGAVVAVELVGGGRIATDRVVLAAGAWSGGELVDPELRPPVRPVRGEILTLRARSGEQLPCRRLVVTERVYLVPRASGELVVGATAQERGFDLAISAGGVHELLREAYRVLPGIDELELVDARVGLRPGTPDNAPLIGSAGVAGLVVASGMYRNGILLAPLIGPAVAAALGGRPPPPETEAFDPARFGAGVGR